MEEKNSAGIYAVTLYAMGIPVTVTVDDFLLFNYSDLAFGNIGVDGSLWGPILEKAAAKLYGNYEMLQGGFMGPAMQMLTGAPYYDYWHSDEEDPDELWDYVNEKISSGWLVNSSSGGFSDLEMNDIGIHDNHAYTVLNTVIVGDGIKLYKVRNPHGGDSYYGPWYDDSELWDETLKEEAGYEGSVMDGIFFISAADYARSFIRTTVVPDVSNEFLNYHAFFDVETPDGQIEETIKIRSEVDQEVFISGYTYDGQHLRNGACLYGSGD